MVSCQKGPTRHAYAWQMGPLWQDTHDFWCLLLATDAYPEPLKLWNAIKVNILYHAVTICCCNYQKRFNCRTIYAVSLVGVNKLNIVLVRSSMSNYTLTETETSLFNSTTWQYTGAWYQTHMTLSIYHSELNWFQLLICMSGHLC